MGFQVTLPPVRNIDTPRNLRNALATLSARRTVEAIFNPSANVGERTIGQHNLLDIDGREVVLPAGVLLTNAYLYVGTTFTSAGADAGTIGLVSGAIIVPIAISNVANRWDAGGSNDVVIPGGSLYVLADQPIYANVAVQALTAGKFYLYLDYIARRD